ncbi:MAG: EAL domain-containing protein [Gammaproteobacteria bacterium]|nr:EAL domain-containing protein [Gammaproteobacteria bacterium]
MGKKKQTHDFYHQLIEGLHEGVWLVDKHHNTTFVNQAMADLLGYEVADMLHKNIFKFMSEKESTVWKHLLIQYAKIKSYSRGLELLHKEGHGIYVRISLSPVFDEQDEYDGTVIGVVDDTDLRHQDHQLKLLSSAVEQSATLVVITNEMGMVQYVNPKFCELTGYAADEIIDQNIKILRSSSFKASELAEVWKVIVSGNAWQGEVSTKKKNGETFSSLMSISPIKNEQNEVINFVAVGEDITRLKDAQSIIEQLAYVDSLTGLANRVLFRDRIEQVLKNIKRSRFDAALLYLDLDQFKRINDSLGHDVGDALLMNVADRLRDCVRHQDTVARMGGDEFVILLTNIDGVAGATLVARKILQIMNKPIRLLSHEIIITPSIGITMAPADSLNADILLKNADLAMYRAKSQGRNNYQFFTDEMNAKATRHLEIENELRMALDKDQIEIYFQPQVSIKNRELVGVEALVRWNHPERGILSPDQFIQVAEETGLIITLGWKILKQSCIQWCTMKSKGLEIPKMAVNLSSRQFRDPNLLEMIQAIFDRTGFNPLNLELEITESLLMDDMEHAISVLKQLKDIGISISIDDFGTGYSSLSYLKRLPIDSLKVDRSFITDIPNDKDDIAITAAVIAMAHKLRLKVVAEGVETQAQLDFLQKNHCDIGQGYLFGKPMKLGDFLKHQ